MVVGQLVDGAGVHLTPNAIELQLTVDVVAENVLEAVLGRRRVQPGVIVGRVENERLPIMQLLHRFCGRLGDDGAAGYVEIGIVSPKPGERERRVAWLVDVPRVFLAVGWRYRPLVEAIGRDQAALGLVGASRKAGAASMPSILALNIAALGISFAQKGTSHQRPSRSLWCHPHRQ